MMRDQATIAGAEITDTTKPTRQSLRRADGGEAGRGSEKQIFYGAARGQLCDRNVRDDFTQPSNSPDHGIKPVWRAINGAVPLAAEGHHFALELIEPAAMQDTLLFI